MTMHEVSEAVSIVEKAAGDEVNLIHGVVYSEDPSEELMVTVVATGFNKHTHKEHIENNQPLLNNNDFFNNTKFDANKLRTTFGFDNSASLPVQQAAAKTYATIEIANSPRGEQLKKYEKPAFERRGKNNENGNGINNDKQQANTINEPITSKIYDQPAFLRRIMD